MNRLFGFAVGLGVTLVGVVLMVVLICEPTAKDAPLFVVLFALPLIVAIFAAFVGQRWAWWRHFRRLSLALFIVYAIGAGLILLTMLVTTQLMFLSAHDAELAIVIVIYATGVTLVFGFFVVSSLTDSIGQLTLAAQSVQRGDLSVRADDRGSDEVATLARTFNDMTRQLASVRAKEQQLDQARRDWIAWVSHDLRTPLTSLRARAEALTDGVVAQPAEVAAYLNAIRADTFALSHLIDDLSELARIDAGGLTLDRMPYPLSELLSDAVEGMRVLADERGVALTWHAAEDVGTPSISPRHIQRVLTNLIGNALTHTPRGGSVEVEAQRLGDVVRVEVRDTGEGIAPADLPHVFERFYRGEPSRSRPPVQTGGTGGTGGMGLGLVIAKALVEAHGGRIGITSEVGRGTTAWFEV